MCLRCNDASLGIAPLQVSEFFGTGLNPSRLESRHPHNAPYQAFKAADDYLVLAAGNQRLFEIVYEVTQRPELLADDRFDYTLKRAKNQHALAELFTKSFFRETASYWNETFSKAGVPVAPINRYEEVLKVPQVVDQQWVQDLQLPNSNLTNTFGHPVRLDGENLPLLRSPPLLVEHRKEIIGSLENVD